jgi:type III pantothenate kinase
MDLLVDIGNSTTKVARYEGGTLYDVHRMETHHTSTGTVERLIAGVGPAGPIDNVVVSTVVPEVKDSWKTAARVCFGTTPFFVTHHAKLGIRISYDAPGTIGADRLVNASAAVDRFGAPVVVVDIGTAVTVDAVAKTRGFIGGVIAPGPGFMREYLAERTSQLLRVDVAPVAPGIGQSTEEAMRIGAWHGYQGLLKELVRCALSALRSSSVSICATGGGAAALCQDLGMTVAIEPNLTLLGLGRIAELNDLSEL